VFLKRDVSHSDVSACPPSHCSDEDAAELSWKRNSVIIFGRWKPLHPVDGHRDATSGNGVCCGMSYLVYCGLRRPIDIVTDPIASKTAIPESRYGSAGRATHRARERPILWHGGGNVLQPMTCGSCGDLASIALAYPWRLTGSRLVEPDAMHGSRAPVNIWYLLVGMSSYHALRVPVSLRCTWHYYYGTINHGLRVIARLHKAA
jgi:hypothetical protein